MSSRDHTDHARLLLGKAAEVQRALEAFASDDRIADAILGFHAQQAVEKLLKAVLSSRAISYPWTHDLRFLIELLEQSGAPMPEGLTGARALTPWAAEFRYGESLDDPLDRDGTIALVRAVREWAESAVAGA